MVTTPTLSEYRTRLTGLLGAEGEALVEAIASSLYSRIWRGTIGRLTGSSGKLTVMGQGVILRLYSDGGQASPYQDLMWEIPDEIGGHGEYT